MCRELFHSSLIILLASMAPIMAQTHSMEAEKTVNPATGEMSFAVPLLTVESGPNKGFPLYLGYKAGIRTYDQASNVGLGFGLATGGIARKVVQVPDDETAAYQIKADPKKECDEDNEYCTCETDEGKKWLNRIIKVLLIIVGLIIMIVYEAFGGSGSGIMIFLMILELALTLGLQIINYVVFSPADYIAGGEHTPRYNYDACSNGFFAENGSTCDLPDIYFVQTPYLTGEMAFKQRNPDGSFEFVMKSSDSPEAVKITYKDNFFKATLKDGTRLHFSSAGKSKSKTESWGRMRGDDADCEYKYIVGGGYTHMSWNLTHVAFPNHGNQDMFEETNTDSWIHIEYRPIGSPSAEGIWQIDERSQADERTVKKTYTRLSEIKYPVRIVSRIHTAEFHYEWDRLDVGLHVRKSDSYIPLLTPRLTGISLYDKQGRLQKSISFETDYTLRPNTRFALAAAPAQYYTLDPEKYVFALNSDPLRANPNKASLTLKSVTLQSPKNTEVPLSLRFAYDKSTNYSLKRVGGECPKGNEDGEEKYIVEERDLWGYYTDAGSNQDKPANDFNINGLGSKALKFDAWSLRSLVMPSGKRIRWDYEPNRYIQANNVVVYSGITEDKRAIPKYGGGIRVKKVTVSGPEADHETHNYFYAHFYDPKETEDPTTTCSGHATVEPYPYTLPSSQDPRRNPAQRGGLYTPAKVAYRHVYAVKDYNKHGNGSTPTGYTRYTFIDSDDYPNEGSYGELDNSWKRGMLKSEIAYNSEGEQVAYKRYHYRTVPGADYMSKSSEFYPKNGYGCVKGIEAIRWGTVQKDYVEETRNGITHMTDWEYTNDLTDEPGGKDFVYEQGKFTQDVNNAYEQWGKYLPEGPCIENLSPKVWGARIVAHEMAEDALKPELISVWSEGDWHDDFNKWSTNNNSVLCLAVKVDFDKWDALDNEPVMWTGIQRSCEKNMADRGRGSFQDALSSGGVTVIGAELLRLTGNTSIQDLLVITYSPLDYPGSGNGNIYNDEYWEFPLTGFIFEDLEVKQIDGQGELEYAHVFPIALGKARALKPEYSSTYPYYPNREISSCAVHNIYGRDGLKPEIVTVSGDGYPYFGEMKSKRMFTVLTDLNISGYNAWEKQAPHGDKFTHRAFYKESETELEGSVIRFTDYQGDGTADDLEMTGIVYEEEGIARTILKQFSANAANGVYYYPEVLARMMPHYSHPHGKSEFPTPHFNGTYVVSVDTYEQFPYGPRHHFLFTSLIKFKQRLTTISEYESHIFSDWDGLPNRIITSYEDVTRVSEPQRAYWGALQYPMRNKMNMLSQSGGQILKSGKLPVHAEMVENTVLFPSKTQKFVHFDLDKSETIEAGHKVAFSFTGGATKANAFMQLGLVIWYDCGKVRPDKCGKQAYRSNILGLGLSERGQASDVLRLSKNPEYTFTKQDLAYPIARISLVAEIPPQEQIQFDKITCQIKSTPAYMERHGSSVKMDVLAATAIRWEVNDNGAWNPIAEYSWNSPVPSGQPNSGFFDKYTKASDDPNWLVQRLITRYDPSGMISETSNQQNVFATSIFSHGALKIATVANARFSETGVYTCDYDAKDRITYTKNHKPMALDGVNGWEYGLNSNVQNANVELVTLDKNDRLFGDECLSVRNAFGPTRNFKLEPNTDYILSAWVRVKSGGAQAQLHADYRKLHSDDTDGEFPYLLGKVLHAVSGSPKTISAPEKIEEEAWVYKELLIQATEDLKDKGNDWYTRVHVGFADGLEGTAYLQDVRFYPTDAHVISRYYDQAHRKPLVVVDANGHPGRKVAFDGFGRPELWYEPVFADQALRGWKKVQEREYHLVEVEKSSK